MTSNATNEIDNETDSDSNNDNADDDLQRIVSTEIDPTTPTPQYEFDRDENPGLHTAFLAQLLDDYPLLMHVLQAAVKEDGAINHGTIHKYLDAEAVSRNNIQEAFWALERLDVLATDDHSNYLARISSDIYMSFYSIATEGHEPTDPSYKAIDLRDFTLPRLLVFDLLLSKHYQDGFTMDELEEHWGIPIFESHAALQWLLENNLVTVNDDESYTINKDNKNVKKFYQIQTGLTGYGGAVLHHDVAATFEYYDEHGE